jgi:hypothetical protein
MARLLVRYCNVALCLKTLHLLEFVSVFLKQIATVVILIIATVYLARGSVLARFPYKQAVVVWYGSIRS